MTVLDNIGPLVSRWGGILVITLMWVLVAAVMIGIAVFILKQKQYKHYTALIFKRKKDKEGKETIVFVGTDNGAIIKDKKLKKRVFRLKKNNVHLGEEENMNFDEDRTLDIPSIPSEKGGEIVFLEKLGPKKFAFGNPCSVTGEIEVIITEADVAEAIRSYDINAKYYGGKEWQKWIGPISFAVFAVLIIVLIFIVLQKFEILAKVSDRLVEVAQLVNTGKTSAVASGVPG